MKISKIKNINSIFKSKFNIKLSYFHKFTNKNFATNDEIKQDFKKTSDIQTFKDSQIIIYTRQINFDSYNQYLLYSSNYAYQSLFRSLIFDKKLSLPIIFIGITGIFTNINYFFYLFPIFIIFRKNINFLENLTLLKIYYMNSIITKIYIDKSLKIMYINLNDGSGINLKIKDNFFLTKEMSRISFPVYDDNNTRHYKLFANDFLYIRNLDRYFALPIDGDIYDKELLGHVLKGRIMISPEVPEMKIFYTAEKNQDGNDYNTEEY